MRIVLRAMLGLLASCAVVSAQPTTHDVEVDPILCWWRTDLGSVRVGQPFTLVLTCSVLQTDAVRVLAEESRLDPAVVQFPPFEVIGGRRVEAESTRTRRFFQFEYVLRIVSEEAFGRDVAIPPLQVTYRVETRVNASRASGARDSDAVLGRDLIYALPPLTLRIASMVPDTATDIREGPGRTFAHASRAAFRSTVLRVGAIVMFGLGVLMAAAVGLRYVRRRQPGIVEAGWRARDAAILSAVRQELAAAGMKSREAGWTSDDVGPALAALRIAAAYATGRRVAQSSASPDTIPTEGQLLVGRGTRSVLVSANVTPNDLAAERLPSHAALRDALVRLSAVRYSPGPDTDQASIDAAFERAVRAVDDLAADYTRFAETAAAARAWLPGSSRKRP